MKRLITFVVCAALVAPWQGASAGKKWTWEERRSYGTYNYVGSSGSEPVHYNLLEPVSFEVYSSELWANVALLDRSGRNVAASVTQDADDDGTPEQSWDICGETKVRLRVVPGTPLVVTPRPGTCDASMGTMTDGKIKVTTYHRAKLVKPKIKTTRLEGFSYTTPAIYETAGGASTSTGEMAVETGFEEGYAELEAKDASGLPVRIQVFVDQDAGTPAVELCGGSKRPISFTPGTPVSVRVLPGPCADGTPAAATTGTISLKLSNLP